ncbi:gelsolin-related protein of 125 kDa isoform X1 [Durio zibethinus]|uniref:Gelsolin-related protein of 125 kDa isoform X1 n=1 Tax=Durio zibethinus TaxID=66656 RepID=A0A6P6AEU7_DURZI|nr:gelsolin-related protein of 125 kDa isoform X1 [Durio zibethinus]
MKMVSDSDLVARLREILRDSDLDTATAGSVRRQLEEDFRVDLSDRKGFVRDQIDIFLETLNQENEREEQEPESENSHLQEEEEEESKGEGSQKTRRASKADKQVKKRGGGFQKVCSLSPQLQKVVGESELPRTEVVKKLWLYIRENNLQDPKNKRNIICDESLHAIFRVNSINMFQMNKALTKHIWPLSAEDENVKHETKCEDSDDSVSVDAENAEEEEKEEERDEQMEEEEEEEDKEQEGNAHGSKQKRPSKVDKDVKRRGGGFTKLCSLSPQLQAFIGEPELARTEVVKRLWTYIREKNLQDPNNRRNILCDESLHALFRVNSINMFQMNKALSKHIWPLNEEDAHADSTKMERKSKQARERGANEPKQKEKKQKKAGSGFLAPLPLSDALVKFFGTGENALSRADVVKRMWEYIKQNDLQDPSDKRRILCDDKLKELFEVDSFNGFTIPKLLTTHFIKI